MLWLAHLGRVEEVHALLDRQVVRRPGVGTAKDETSVMSDCYYLEAAVLVGQREAAALLLRRLGESPLPVSGYALPTCPARHLGAAASRWTEQALRDAAQVEFRPELALAHLQMAELLLEDGDETQRHAALGHLDFAIGEFRAMQMQPALERALSHKAVLQA